MNNTLAAVLATALLAGAVFVMSAGWVKVQTVKFPAGPASWACTSANINTSACPLNHSATKARR